MPEYFKQNRNRLTNILSHIEHAESPAGWEKVASFSVGGFLAFGFSKQRTNLCLICSSSGRSLVDCSTGNKIERDYEEDEGFDELRIYCKGIGEISTESILISGLNGGGLPMTTSMGESLALVAPEWPRYDLIFCKQGGSALIDGYQHDCVKITTDFIEACGFSWCGNYFATSLGSDFEIWKRTNFNQ